MGKYNNNNNKFLYIVTHYSVTIGFLLRIVLAWFLPWLLDTGRLLPGVAYTDIDYHVFTDAARYIQQGNNPYDRHTYRYTPFLAQVLATLQQLRIQSNSNNPPQIGRYLFCLADTLCGKYILELRQQQRREQQHEIQQPNEQSPSSPSNTTDMLVHLQDALWWLYNPLAIHICTRGSAESLMVLLPVVLTIRTICTTTTTTRTTRTTTTTTRTTATNTNDWKNAITSGVWHGIAVHSKLYPIIYTLSYMAYFAIRPNHHPVQTIESSLSDGKCSCTWATKLLLFIRLWFFRLCKPLPIIFFMTFLITSSILTYLAVVWYGDRALQEGFLYHFSRVDHRHNYSMYWYWIYLARAQQQENSKMVLMSRLLTLPQIVLLVFISLGVAPYNLTLALFLQTYSFVTHNKVITAQYFTWYLCLLPLCSHSFQLSKRVQRALAVLALSIGCWLGSAYCLEMQGMAVHKIVWMASIGHFWANVNLLSALMHSSNETMNMKQKQTKVVSKTE